VGFAAGEENDETAFAGKSRNADLSEGDCAVKLETNTATSMRPATMRRNVEDPAAANRGPARTDRADAIIGKATAGKTVAPTGAATGTFATFTKVAEVRCESVLHNSLGAQHGGIARGVFRRMRGEGYVVWESSGSGITSKI
jgi:hypothetical protein